MCYCQPEIRTPFCNKCSSVMFQDIKHKEAQIKILRKYLVKAREDINWMLNSREFLNAFVFDYIDDVLEQVKE